MEIEIGAWKEKEREGEGNKLREERKRVRNKETTRGRKRGGKRERQK